MTPLEQIDFVFFYLKEKIQYEVHMGITIFGFMYNVLQKPELLHRNY